METLARVSSKGQVVIPAELRRKLKITRLVVISEEGGNVIVRPTMSLEDAFGVDGSKMRDVARGISTERRREAESERP
ncbi:MAG: AbrB/MazE/SpoVT family DNA-binding domain-containing protein [Nitrososphaerota archaeon]|nr:AbrB/MazE/SpoVT family DNA-binding domain-containing protein [Nitrososphaerota archaeon]MDG7025980.1 AbrB/MazE/SpoVT family DNA-binding domain-containing protein [Nitrososphaerota archaeon]